ncbi:hypothetical protein LINGRAHAP2_LOCUS29492 [Linum grandiflorum]
MGYWAKKELSKLLGSRRFITPPRPPLLLNQPPPPPPLQDGVVKVVVAADLRCSDCTDRFADAISSLDLDDVESLEVDFATKEVTLLLHRRPPPPSNTTS